MDMRAAVRALRDQEDAGGAVTANARMMAQVLRNRQAYERNQAQGGRGALEYGANVLSAVPVVGDVLGLARDVAMFRDEPETRTPTNIGLAALGLIPFVPPAVSYGLGRLAEARGVKTGPTPGSLAAALRGQRGAIVYHGSPHRFDRFDSSKIGTGEGAQAYGHGLYLAESPDVAKSYQQTLAGKAHSKLEQIDRNNYRVTAPDGTVIADGVTLGAATKVKTAFDANAGSLYTVDLPDPMIARMLDWDKPLSQQAPEVRRVLESNVEPIRREMAKPAPGWGEFSSPQAYDPAGSELLSLLKSRNEGLTAQDILNNGLGPAVSQYLRQQGIPGIRYLDASSRGTGSGTSNFVVFPGEESALRILRRE